MGVGLLLQPDLRRFLQLPGTLFNGLTLLLWQVVQVNEAEVVGEFVGGEGTVELSVFLLGIGVRTIEIKLLIASILSSHSHVIVVI